MPAALLRCSACRVSYARIQLPQACTIQFTPRAVLQNCHASTRAAPSSAAALGPSAQPCTSTARSARRRSPVLHGYACVVGLFTPQHRVTWAPAVLPAVHSDLRGKSAAAASQPDSRKLGHCLPAPCMPSAPSTIPLSAAAAMGRRSEASTVHDVPLSWLTPFSRHSPLRPCRSAPRLHVRLYAGELRRGAPFKQRMCSQLSCCWADAAGSAERRRDAADLPPHSQCKASAAVTCGTLASQQPSTQSAAAKTIRHQATPPCAPDSLTPRPPLIMCAGRHLNQKASTCQTKKKHLQVSQ